MPKIEKKKGVVLVRYEDGTHTLTYKSDRQGDRFGSREEIETQIADPDEVRRILKHVGLKESATYHKETSSWWANQCVVSLDVISGVGTYLEVEGQEKEILEVLEVLGLKNREPERRSYFEILLAA